MSACPRRPFADVKQRQQHLINPWSHQKSGPLRYSRKSANYKPDLPPHIKIHSVVSVIHLDPAPRPLRPKLASTPSY